MVDICFQRLTHKRRLHACRPTALPGADRGHHPEQPYCHSAADPAARAHESRAMCPIALAAEPRPARRRRPADCRGHADFACGQGLCRAPGFYNKRKCRPGSRLPPPCTPRAGAWPCSCGMWAGCRTPACSRSTPPRWPHRHCRRRQRHGAQPGWPIGPAPCSLPRALETAEIADLIEDHRQATDRCAAPALIWWKCTPRMVIFAPVSAAAGQSTHRPIRRQRGKPRAADAGSGGRGDW